MDGCPDAAAGVVNKPGKTDKKDKKDKKNKKHKKDAKDKRAFVNSCVDRAWTVKMEQALCQTEPGLLMCLVLCRPES